MAANTGINGVLLTNIIKINGVTVAGSNKNVAGAILNFGGASATTTTTTAGTGGTSGGSGYAVRLYGDPRSGGGWEDPSVACQGGKGGFPVSPGNLYLDEVDSMLKQVSVFFDPGLTTPYPGLNDGLYYYVESRSDPRLDAITLQGQDASQGWVQLLGPC